MPLVSKMILVITSVFFSICSSAQKAEITLHFEPGSISELKLYRPLQNMHVAFGKNTGWIPMPSVDGKAQIDIILDEPEMMFLSGWDSVADRNFYEPLFIKQGYRLNIVAQLVKIYSNKKGEETEDNETKKHYRYKGARKEIRSGEPNETFISTSYIERKNLTVRTNVRRFTRKTNAFSKKYLNHCYAVALHYFHYNFVRLHKSLNMTPAMSAGLTKRFLTMTDLVAAID